MKAELAGSTSSTRQPRWRRQIAVLRRRGPALIEAGTVVAWLAVVAVTWGLVSGGGTSERLLKPPVVALLLVANLVPLLAFLVLFARRIAKRHAAGSGAGTGARLHVRLVAIFSVIVAVPTLLVVVVASLLFQYGVQFWFSDSARTVLTNSDRVAQAYVSEHRARIISNMRPMASDFADFLSRKSLDDPGFAPGMGQQLAYRELNELALIQVSREGIPHILALTNLQSNRPASELMPVSIIPALDRGAVQTSAVSNRMEARIAVNPAAHLYLYASRTINPLVVYQSTRAKRALGAYLSLIDRSRSVQLRFNAALFIISLLIVAAAIFAAFTVADRLTRPITTLVAAARRITLGDLSVRVPAPTRRDEVGALATAFNRMTRRVEEQTGALVTANAQLDERRAFTEAVLSGVSAGVVSVDGDRCVRLINNSAASLLKTRGETPIGQPLAELAPELDALIEGGQREAIVQFASAGDMRTLAVTVVGSDSDGGHVITFDDITQQLLDQRRAAWSDVARRIAHEIKNPLTPIQLAAERLQRRYGKEIASDPATFERLTQTIVRQVGDLRRMVDEFSSFARVPKPVFRSEPLVEIARQALFLHEVAHTAIRFSLDAPESSPILVCDRRLLGQALTNIVKNAVEAIQEKGGDGEAATGDVAMRITQDTGRIEIALSDTGIGLPAERERMTEPYMTTRARGTGLGLAIVKKIVEEHFGTIGFEDREGGGTIVRIALDTSKLAPLAGGGEEDAGADESRPELTRKTG